MPLPKTFFLSCHIRLSEMESHHMSTSLHYVSAAEEGLGKVAALAWFEF